jgi:hypothetical protein
MACYHSAAAILTIEMFTPKVYPRTFQCPFDSDYCCDQKVNFTRLNFLKAAQMQIRKFREFFLSQIAHVTFAADVRAQAFDVSPICFRKWHAPLRRKTTLTGTPYRA